MSRAASQTPYRALPRLREPRGGIGRLRRRRRACGARRRPSRPGLARSRRPNTSTTTPVPIASTRAGRLGSRSRRSASSAPVASTAAAHTQRGRDARRGARPLRLRCPSPRAISGCPRMTRITAALADRRDHRVHDDQRAVRDQDHERDQPDGDGDDTAARIGQVGDARSPPGPARGRARAPAASGHARSARAPGSRSSRVNAATPFQ